MRSFAAEDAAAAAANGRIATVVATLDVVVATAALLAAGANARLSSHMPLLVATTAEDSILRFSGRRERS